MKKTILVITLFIFFSQIVSGQEIKVSALFLHTDYNKFKNNIGYEIGYDYYFKSNNRIGVSFSQSFNNTAYNYVFQSTSDGRGYHRAIKPENQRKSFSVNYDFNILSKNKSNFYIGPELGLSYFKVYETGTERPLDETESYEYKRDYSATNKLGLGLLLEYDRKILSDNLSIFFAAKPEIVFYSKFGQRMGSNTPTTIEMLNVNLGLRFNIGNKVTK